MRSADERGRTAGKAIISAFLVASVIKIFVLDFMIAEGQSMIPVIKPGAVLFVCKTYYGLRMPFSNDYFVNWKKPREGDVVIFHTPYGEIAVKRCAEITESGELYLLGDNNSQSFDSRNYGAIEFNSIIGKVLGMGP